MMSVSLCNNNNIRKPTFYKCCLFKPGDFVLKIPRLLCNLVWTWYSLAQVLFLSEIIICSFNNNELRNGPMAKLFILCTVPNFSQ